MNLYEKKYKEALKLAKSYHNDPNCFKHMEGTLEHIFPELKESEDEKIRKALCEFVHDTTGDELWVDYCVHKEDAIDWLEKQGEQKQSTDIVWNFDPTTGNMRFDNLTTEQAEKLKTALLGEQKHVEPTDIRTWKYIVDAVLTERNGIGRYIDSPWTEYMAKKLQERFGSIEQKLAWSEDDEKIIEDVETWLDILCKYLEDSSSECIPVIKELISKLKSFRPQKQEWSEEDEAMFRSILTDVKIAWKNTLNAFEDDIEQYQEQERCMNEVLSFLKSLRPQKQWKPSEEQMKAVEKALSLAKNCGEEYSFDLRKLLEQLKILKNG